MEYNKLKELYYNPDSGFSSLQKLIGIAKEHKLKLTNKQIEQWYNSQNINQIYGNKQNDEFIQIKANDIGYLQADLMDISKYSKYNHGYHFILTIADVYSRYVWAFPLKSKNAEQISEYMEQVLNIINKKDRIITLTTDMGKEFDNSHMKKILDKFNVLKHFLNDNSKQDHPTVTAIVERFHRTLWNYFKKYTNYYDTLNFIDKLNDFINNYNKSIHSTINVKPIDVLNGKVKPHIKKVIVENPYKVGIYVRYQKKLVNFAKKSFEPKYSDSVYKIKEVLGNRYTLENPENGNVIEKTFLKRELLPVIDYIKNESKYEQQLQTNKQEKKYIKEQRKSGLDVDKEGAVIIPKYLVPSRPKREIKKVNKLDL
jgi:hypothetical protein